MSKEGKGIVFMGQVAGVRTRKDRTVNISIDTQELPADTSARLFAMGNDIANVYLSPSAIQVDIMKEIDLVTVDLVDLQKTPSKRLKSVLYLLWKQDNEGYTDPELYYRWKMEGIINHFKSKLD